jgi:hypothetical protein
VYAWNEADPDGEKAQEDDKPAAHKAADSKAVAKKDEK